MGLDIHLTANNQEELYEDTEEYFYSHSLSRAFCNFMLRQHAVESGAEPELNQIGRLTGVDIAPLYAMETYPQEEEIEFRLQVAENGQEKEDILKQAEIAHSALQNNIDAVLSTVNLLIRQLTLDPTLLQLLHSEWGTEGAYFSDFPLDKGDGYINNNFGHDLRNFRRFLEHAKRHGSTTVYFHYA